MESSVQHPRPRTDIVHRAEHMAKDAGQLLPGWLQPGNQESRWPVLVALIVAILMQRVIPVRYTVVPRWPLIPMEALLVVVLLIINPVRLTRSTKVGAVASVLLLAAITIDNSASAGAAESNIVTGKEQKTQGV